MQSKTRKEYILDVLEDEQKRLLEDLRVKLSEETKYLFFRYISVKDEIAKIKFK